MWQLLVVIFGVGLSSGILLSLGVAYYLYRRYLALCVRKDTSATPYVEPQLAPNLQKFLDAYPRPEPHQNEKLPKEQLQTLNLVLAELFYQLRDTVPVKKFFFRTLDRTFNNLRKNTSVRRICQRFTVSDINFGATMPTIISATPVRPRHTTLGKSDHIEVEVELSYEGKFHMQVDADLIFSKKAKVSITIVSLSGVGRFAVRQQPHSHWAFAFVEDPKLQLEVEATFEGRLIPQLSTIIKTQIRNAMHRFHVLPTQQKRYAPFFPMPQVITETALELYGVRLFAGNLDVEVLQCRDLPEPRSAGTGIFVHMSLTDEEQEDDVHIQDDDMHEQEVEVFKAGAGGTIGISFKAQERESNGCQIEAIKPGSPASALPALQPGCVVKAINGIGVMTTSQAMKLIKESASSVVLRFVSSEEAQAANARGNNATERRNMGYARTPVVPASQNPVWKYKGHFAVEPSHTRLYVRVYDCRVRRGEIVGKRFLIGYTEVDIETAALFCAANQAPMLRRYPLRKAANEGAPDVHPKDLAKEVGVIELLIKHQPRPFDYFEEGSSKTTPSASAKAASRVAAAKAKTPTAPQPEFEEEDDDDLDDELDDYDDLMESSSEKTPTGAAAKSKKPEGPGMELFGDLPPAQRRQELEQLMDTVKMQLELETETHAELERQLREATRPADIARLRSNIKASEERKDELNIRAFKCVAALSALEDMER